MPLTPRHHGGKKQYEIRKQSENSHDKKNKVPQFSFLNQAQQDRKQTVAKYKQVLIAPKFAAPLLINRNLHPRESHT